MDSETINLSMGCQWDFQGPPMMAPPYYGKRDPYHSFFRIPKDMGPMVWVPLVWVPLTIIRGSRVNHPSG